MISYQALYYQEKHVKIHVSQPGQIGHHFTGDIDKCIYVNEKFSILI